MPSTQEPLPAWLSEKLMGNIPSKSLSFSAPKRGFQAADITTTTPLSRSFVALGLAWQSMLDFSGSPYGISPDRLSFAPESRSSNMGRKEGGRSAPRCPVMPQPRKTCRYRHCRHWRVSAQWPQPNAATRNRRWGEHRVRVRSNILTRQRNAHAEFSLHDGLHRAVLIVFQMLDGNSTPAGRAFHVADRQCGVM